MVAGKLAAKAVLHQPAVTLRTANPVPTGPAEGERRITAPIEEKHGLLALGEGVRNRPDKGRGDPLSFLRRMGAHIDCPHGGHHSRTVPLRQHQMVIFARPDIDHRLKRWRSRRKHNRETAERSAHNTHIAGIIRNPVILLEGTFMLFINNNEPKIRVREKERRTGADNHLRRPVCHRAPYTLALPCGKIGVPLRRAAPETTFKSFEKLPGECNFRQKNERLASLRQHLCHSFKIDLGLARPCHTIKQVCSVPALDHPCADLLCSQRLLCGQRRRIKIRYRRWERCIGRQGCGLKRPGVHKTAHDSCRNPRLLRELPC